MPTIREIFFSLKKENNKYLNDSVIKTLLSYLGGFSFEDFPFHLDDQFCNDKLYIKVEEIKEGKPIQYVTNDATFLGNHFYVDSSVLIPRQETEQLVLDIIKQNHFKNPKILDIGTGSGCIAISLKKQLNCECFALDISKEALKIAEINAKLNGTKVEFIESDVFDSIPLEMKFDIIVSNPPYIKDESTVDKSTLKYEPHIALFAKPQTYFYEKIFIQSKQHLNKQFLLAFEIEENMEKQLCELGRIYFPGRNIIFTKDMYGKTRFMYIM